MASSAPRTPRLPVAVAGLFPVAALAGLPAVSMGASSETTTTLGGLLPAEAGDRALAEATALAGEAALRLTSLTEVRETVEARIVEAEHYPDAWPVLGRVTSRFGERHSPFDWGIESHEGIDIAAPYGTAIHAAAAGVVIEAGWVAGFGRAVKIDHGNGLVTLYGHQSRVRVHVGETVRKGEVIGYIGTSGLSTGPHLHFGVYRNGVAVDPLRYLLSDRFDYLRR
ncbi:MAG: M23 family metallopeptidase [Clostridia bacterium]|nr:M23 family metallopeptidase [Clostridia bacterium]